MNSLNRCLQIVFFFSLTMILVSAAFTQNSTIKSTEDFQKGWQQNWVERMVYDKPANYEVVEEDSNSVLMVVSENSASALWRMLEIQPGRRGKLSWSWKVENSLSGDAPEKSKKGDDYAARLYVVFEPNLVSWKTRSICYVWAAKEPVGRVFKSPYANSVAIVVVQSGDKNKNKWIEEERNIIFDYQKIFGKSPEMITALAIMVDTDNSHQSAYTWFDDINLEVSEVETDSTQKNKPDVKFD